MFAAKIGCKAALARLDKVAQRVLISDKSIFIVQISSRRQFQNPPQLRVRLSVATLIISPPFFLSNPVHPLKIELSKCATSSRNVVV